LNQPLPRYLDVELREVLDAGRDGDRYVAVFDDGTLLAIRHDGHRSSWLDEESNFDPWTLARRVPYEELPNVIRSEILRRAKELDDVLRS
jgi:hypothetical protein